MSTFWILWLVITLFNLTAGYWIQRYDERQTPSKDGVSLAEVLVMIFFAVCPLAQWITAGSLIVYFFSDIAPNIKIHWFDNK
jgi:hypothetical protein